jgi:hypothetical protein
MYFNNNNNIKASRLSWKHKQQISYSIITVRKSYYCVILSQDIILAADTVWNVSKIVLMY